MKRKTSYIAVLAASLLVLAACGGGGGESSSVAGSSATGENSSTVEDSSTATGTSTGGGQTSSTTEDPVSTFRVIVRAPSGITITSDKATAAVGETVTLSYTLSAGYSLNAIILNGTAIPHADGKASFTMPDREAIISASLDVEGDVTLSGDIAAPFILEEGIYVSRNVSVSTDSDVTIRIAGDGGDGYIGYSSLDYRKCFGNITYAYEQMNGITPIELGNNAIYDIYYDPSLPSDRCVYIQRVGVINLPDSSSMMQDLFEGSIYSESPNFPSGVNHVEYYSSIEAADYSWDLYEGASLATITPRLTGSPRYVYKDISNGVYTVVDNYVENPYDSTRLDDSRAFSGRYAIVDEVGEKMGNFEVTEDDALFDVSHYSHDVESLDFSIHYGYRTGFDNTYNDSLKTYACNISSVRNEDEGFTISVSSWKTYGPGTYESDAVQEHIVYEIEATFTKAGAPLSGTYVEKTYDSTSYDFTNDRFLSGGEANPSEEVNKSWEYGYGEAKSGKPTFDTTPYFATSIEASFVYLGQEMTSFDPGINLSDRLQVAVTPSTALDASQYVITSSSDTSVVYKDTSRGDWYVSTEANGSTKLTISHPTVNTGVSTSYTVASERIGIRNFYIWDGYVSGGHSDTSTSTWVYEGMSYTTNLMTSCGSAGDVGSLADITFSYSVEGYLTASVDEAARTITFDATQAKGKMTSESLVITVTIHSPYYDLEWWGTSFKESTIAVTIYANSTSIDASYLLGDWRCEDAATTGDDTLLTFTDTAGKTDGYKTASLTLDGDVFSFEYYLDMNTNAIQVSNVRHMSGSTYSYDDYYIDFNVEWTTNKIGICMWAAENDYSSWSTTFYEILGDLTEDDEGYFAASAWVFFVKA